jgi:hypothetical protein
MTIHKFILFCNKKKYIWETEHKLSLKKDIIDTNLNIFGILQDGVYDVSFESNYVRNTVYNKGKMISKILPDGLIELHFILLGVTHGTTFSLPRSRSSFSYIVPMTEKIPPKKPVENIFSDTQLYDDILRVLFD